MYNLIYSTKFKKDIKLCQKRNYDFSTFKKIITLLETNETIPTNYKPHILGGNFSNYREGHIKPDWILIWTQDDENKEIYLKNKFPIRNSIKSF